MPLSVLIVGAGQIGALYDQPGGPRVLTHAHAFSTHPQFELLGFVDRRSAAAEQAAQRWRSRAFPSLAQAVATNEVDVLVVAVPDQAHFEVLREVAKSAVRFVFVEKPFTQSVEQAIESFKLLTAAGAQVSVNYTRRFVPQFRALRKAIKAGEFGSLLRGSAYYGKGSVHNGSHLVNLLQFLFGRVSVEGTLGLPVPDFSPADPTASALLRLGEQGLVALLAVDSRCVTIFELDLLFEKARIRMLESGQMLEISMVVDDPVYAGYQRYGAIQQMPTDLLCALIHAAENIYESLEAGGTLLSPASDAIETLSVCAQLHNG